MKKRPVTFSFAALMSMFVQRTLLSLDEEMDLIYWLTGEEVNIETVTNSHYERAWAKLVSQFRKNFNEDRYRRAKEELDYMMKNVTNQRLRNDLIDGWLASMAVRTEMDYKAYYLVYRKK
jgi:hypothetical protein